MNIFKRLFKKEDTAKEIIEDTIKELKETPIRGPSVTWEISEMKRALDKWGKKKTIKYLANDSVRPEYLEKMIDEYLSNLENDR